MARSEKMEKEVIGELERSGYSAQEASERVRGMRTNELVSAYYHPANIKIKSVVGGGIASTPQPSRKITNWAKYE